MRAEKGFLGQERATKKTCKDMSLHAYDYRVNSFFLFIALSNSCIWLFLLFYFLIEYMRIAVCLIYSSPFLHRCASTFPISAYVSLYTLYLSLPLPHIKAFFFCRLGKPIVWVWEDPAQSHRSGTAAAPEGAPLEDRGSPCRENRAAVSQW